MVVLLLQYILFILYPGMCTNTNMPRLSLTPSEEQKGLLLHVSAFVLKL